MGTLWAASSLRHPCLCCGSSREPAAVMYCPVASWPFACLCSGSQQLILAVLCSSFLVRCAPPPSACARLHLLLYFQLFLMIQAVSFRSRKEADVAPAARGSRGRCWQRRMTRSRGEGWLLERLSFNRREGGAKRGDVNPIEFVLLLGLVRGRKSRGEGRKKGRGIGRE